MSPALAAFLIFPLACLLLLLPMLPAIIELRLKRDAEPLAIIQQHGGAVSHFADGFRQSVRGVKPSLERCAQTGTNSISRLPAGDDCFLIGQPSGACADSPTASQNMPLDSFVRHVIVSAVDLSLPPGRTFIKEIYCAGKVCGSEGNSYRAILSEQEIHLARASKVMRWAHAVGTFQAAENCDLYGRVSSDQQVVLGAGCAFQRVHARRVATGSGECREANALGSAALSESRPKNPEAIPAGRQLVYHDFEIRPGQVFRGDLVTRGKLRIGAGATVIGSAKSNGDLSVEAGVRITGSLISTAYMEILSGCSIRGPVIAERAMSIASGVQFGSIDTPTTVSAPRIEVAEGTLIFGTLWARELGMVIAIS